jgi:hypothetical protein
MTLEEEKRVRVGNARLAAVQHLATIEYAVAVAVRLEQVRAERASSS